MHTLPADHDDNEAPARLPPDDYCEGAEDFFDLPHKMISNKERATSLKQLAQMIDKWKKSRTYFGKPSPDALVLVMPEGYGKSHLVLDLVKRGFKVVFCAKSHGQLDEKEFGFREQHSLNVKRFTSKRQNFRMQLEAIGIPPNDFKFAETGTINPYAMPKLKEVETLRLLDELFVKHSCAHNPEDFFVEHYIDFVPDIMNPPLNDADVTLITFASLQAITAIHKTSWWKGLGLIEKIIPANEETEKPEKKIPFKKIAIIYDDPDRSDVDWLRPITQEELEALQKINDRRAARKDKKESPEYWQDDFPEHADRLAAGHEALQDIRRSLPQHKIIEYKNSRYMERPDGLRIGHQLKGGAVTPVVIVTTTEWLTGYYALQTLKRSDLNPHDHLDLFHSVDCDVTAISTTITRKRNHAVLLPIIELLKEEFPTEDVTLIANALGCELNLSNNKGRNDLTSKTSIIKLSWPHPSVNATVDAHFADVKNADYDLMFATELADLGNQALGRNQGFRYRDKQAIVLIEPKYYDKIISNNLLRYKLTPWSSKLPRYHKKTSKKKALEAISFSEKQSELEKRLLTLVSNFESFGLSEDARRLAARLPQQQREHFDTWLAKHGSTEAAEKEAANEDAKRARVAANVRRCRERARARSLLTIQQKK